MLLPWLFNHNLCASARSFRFSFGSFFKVFFLFLVFLSVGGGRAVIRPVFCIYFCLFFSYVALFTLRLWTLHASRLFCCAFVSSLYFLPFFLSRASTLFLGFGGVMCPLVACVRFSVPRDLLFFFVLFVKLRLRRALYFFVRGGV